MRADYTKLPDFQLLELSTAGDDLAFRAIYVRYRDRLYSRAVGILKNEDLALDCLQDVLLAFWNFSGKSSITNLDHYLHQSIRFRSLRMLSEQPPTVEMDGRLHEITREVLAAEQVEYKELKAALEKLIAELPEDKRTIFLMHREHGMMYKEIAEELDISVKTVEKKMSDSLKFLRLHTKESLGIIISILLRP